MGVPLSKSPLHEVREVTPTEDYVLKLEAINASLSDRNFRYHDATIKNWNTTHTKILWDIKLVKTGKVNIALGLSNNVLNAGATIRIKIGDQEVLGKTRSSGGWDHLMKMQMGSIDINKPAQYTVEVQAVTLIGLYAGNLVYVLLSGSAVEGGSVILIPPRASYIGFMWNETENCTWFYNSIKISQTFPGTQFSVCGIDHLDIMLLHNDVSHGKYVMFSCLGQYGKDPTDKESRVPNYGPPIIVSKEKGVTKRHFRTDEGGAHCSLTYPWKVNEKYHVLLKIDTASWEDDVTFTAFFYMNEENDWKKIATFKLLCERPDLISGMHSSIRDFYRRHGRFPREAIYGPAWRRKADGHWKELNSVSFFQDGNESNIDAGIEKNGKGFYLTTGGLTKQKSEMTDYECKKSNELPNILKILPD